MIRQIRITTLSENTAGSGFLGEWGLSMLIEVDGQRLLFDTGSGIAAIHNAPLLGVDLATINRIVLSHGHYDHTGGLREVLGRAGKQEIYGHPDIWAKKYAHRKGTPVRYIGIPFAPEELESLGATFVLSREPVEIARGVLTSGEVPRENDYEKVDSHLKVIVDGREKADTLADDLALVIDTEFGLVVILGCAHRGIVNTLHHAQRLTGKKQIYAAIGGTHLISASEERLALTVDALKEMGVRWLAASHCTGFPAATVLAREFGKAFFQNNAGSRFTLPLPIAGMPNASFYIRVI